MSETDQVGTIACAHCRESFAFDKSAGLNVHLKPGIKPGTVRILPGVFPWCPNCGTINCGGVYFVPSYTACNDTQGCHDLCPHHSGGPTDFYCTLDRAHPGNHKHATCEWPQVLMGIATLIRGDEHLSVNLADVAVGDAIHFCNNYNVPDELRDLLEHRLLIDPMVEHLAALSDDDTRRRLSAASSEAATRSPGDGPMSTANLGVINPKLIDGGKR